MNKMRPIHPGEIQREEFLVSLGLSANALALELKVPAPRINDIVGERRAVTPGYSAPALAVLRDQPGILDGSANRL